MKLFTLISLFLFALHISAGDYEDSRIAELNQFHDELYSTDQPTNPTQLIKHWQQVKEIDALVYFYTNNRQVFDRTKFKPHMLHKWAGVHMTFALKNHEDTNVGVLANLITSYKYMLRDRLNGGSGGTYSEVADLTKTAGRKLALLIDEKYADGKIIPPPKPVVWPK